MSEEKNLKRIEFLEIEREKLWDRIIILEQKIDEKPSDIEKEAKQSSRKAAEFRNKTEERLNQTLTMASIVEEAKTQTEENLELIINKRKEVFITSQELAVNGEKLSTILKNINEVLEEYPDIESEIIGIDNLMNKIVETSSKSNTTYKGILSKKIEIDELHREILGYEDEDEFGLTTTVEGLKSKLSKSYDMLLEESKNLENSIEGLKIISITQYNDFIEENQKDLDNVKTKAKNKYDSINKQIESLMPNAMTAGLSSAFIAKKKEEELLYDEYKTSFKKGIWALALVSLLPITISVFFLISGADLIDVIERSPKVVLSFLPLYIPLIWITISANKKVNLSKRLIEEYSHKQVLSMTIEGLSKQIENIDNSKLSEELRIKLLNNFLQVTNENPGKLISNYQKSDNPLLNILDRDKSSNKTIIETLEDSTKEIIEKATNEIEEGISSSLKK